MLAMALESVSALPGVLQAALLPVLILASYQAGANQSLKKYIAVEQLEDAPLPISDEDKAVHRSKRRRRILLAVLFAAAIWGTEAYVIAVEDFDLLNTFVSVLFAVFVAVSTYKFTCQLLNVRHAVYRHANGMVISRLAESDCRTMMKKIAAVFTAIVVNHYILIDFNATVATVCIAMMVTQMTSSGMGKLSSIRKLTIVFIAYEAIIIALSLVMIWAVAGGSEALDSEDAVFPSSGKSEEEQMMLKVHSVVIPAIYSVPVGQYIAACARFDYAQAKKAGLVSAAAAEANETLPALETCAMPKTSTGRTIKGSETKMETIMPSQYRVYYKLTSRVAGACYLILAPLVYTFVAHMVPAADVHKEKDIFNVFYLHNQLFALATMFVTVPLLAIAVAFKARSRNEKKALWTYSEIWFKKPGQAAAVEQTASELETAPLLEKPQIIIEDVDFPVATKQ